MNFYAYYYSDKQVLKHYNATPIEDRRHPVYKITEKLTLKAGLPMPKVYLIPDHTPNAFATGRNHENAAVAVTMGLYEMLNEEELEGVIAHELSHIKHYDILIGTIAAVFAGAIAMIANMMQFGAMFGNNRQSSNPIIMIIMAIILPLAASIIQMTVSRNREFMADEGAARMTGNPSGLQSALAKLDRYAKSGRQIHNATEQTAHMFIVNPFSGLKSNLSGLFRTHPTTEDRIAKLEELKHELR
jgi:heat shock protein HtpX